MVLDCYLFPTVTFSMKLCFMEILLASIGSLLSHLYTNIFCRFMRE